MSGILASLEAVVIGSVAITARALVNAGSELTLVQWRALIVLHASEAPLTIGDVARRVGASPSAMSRLVRRLTVRGYVSSHQELADRRERRIVVTDRGRELVRRIVVLRDRELAALPIDAGDEPALVRLGAAFAGIADSDDPNPRHDPKAEGRLDED